MGRCLQNKKIQLDDGSKKIFLSTKGKLKDVNAKILNFLRFVDGLPVKDKWADEIQGLISELKTDEKEKANYKTYQMKITKEHNEDKDEKSVATALDKLRDNDPLDKIQILSPVK